MYSFSICSTLSSLFTIISNKFHCLGSFFDYLRKSSNPAKVQTPSPVPNNSLRPPPGESRRFSSGSASTADIYQYEENDYVVLGKIQAYTIRLL